MSRMPDPVEKPCPICRKPAEQRYRPFCSRRCADIDLNRWLSGVYTVPVVDEEEAGISPRLDDEEER
jgi:endogenous inhibitor of DNA gyrase (YacG/DUF329 family)